MQPVIEEKPSKIIGLMQGIWGDIKDTVNMGGNLLIAAAQPFGPPFWGATAPKVLGDPVKVAMDIESSLEIGADRRLAMNKENIPLAINEKIAALINKLGNEEFREREDAGEQLNDMGYKAKPALIEAVSSSENPETRTRASVILGGFAGREQVRLRDLITSVKSLYDTRIFYNDHKPSYKPRPEAKSASPALMNILKQEQDPILLTETVNALRAIDASALAQVPESAKQAAPSLVAILQRPGDPENPEDSELRKAATQVLGAIKADPQKVVPALIKVLETNDPQVQPEAALALGEFGAGAKTAVDALIKASENPQNFNFNLKGNAITALGKIKSEPLKVVPVLIDRLENPLGIVRSYAASALKEFGADAAPAKATFFKVLEDRNLDVIPHAIDALVSIAKSPKTTAEDKIKIIEVLNEFRISAPDKDKGGMFLETIDGIDNSTRIREQAAEAIKTLSETLKDVAPASPPFVAPPPHTPAIPNKQKAMVNNG